MAALLAGCAQEPVEESLRIEFLRDHESDLGPKFPFSPERDVRMEIQAEIKLNRTRGDDDNEEFQRRMDDAAAALMGGNDFWHDRFDRLQNPDADGIDLTRNDGLLSRYRLWAVMPDPGPALLNFFSDTHIAPTYHVSKGDPDEAGEPSAPPTVTLTFRPSGESRATSDELAETRRRLLEVANGVVRVRDTLAEMWAYLEETPGKRRDWVSALLFRDDEDFNELEVDFSEYEDELWMRLFDDMLMVQTQHGEVPGDDVFTPRERFRRAFDPFPGVVTVKPDGFVVNATGFVETEDGCTVSSTDISEAVVGVWASMVSPNFFDYWPEFDSLREDILGNWKRRRSPGRDRA